MKAIVAAAICCVVFCTAVAPAPAQPVDVLPDGPEQLPVIYVKGFNDDGIFWAKEMVEAGGQMHVGGWFYFDHVGVPSFIVQWTAPGQNPYASEAEGEALLLLPPAVVDPNNPRRRASDTIAWFIGNSHLLLNPFTWGDFFEEAPNHVVVSNYNQNGRVADHAQDMVDMLRLEFGPTRQLGSLGLRQTNFLTHSAGGLDTRALLHLLNESDSQTERERVANVIFTAPPFGGSTLAQMAKIFYQPVVTEAVFVEPWLVNGLAVQAEPMVTLLVTLTRGPVVGQVAGVTTGIVADRLRGAARALGMKLDVTWDDINNVPGTPTALVALIYTFRPIVSAIGGFPGFPKTDEDLNPVGAVAHLGNWAPNPHTKHFVAWGEGGPQINLGTDDLEAVGNDYSIMADPFVLDRVADDMALSNTSAKILLDSIPNGYVQEVGAYPTLDHGGVALETRLVGADWLRHLIAPVTTLRLLNDVAHADHDARTYVVGPTTGFTFVGVSRTVTDVYGTEVTATAASFQYRIVELPAGAMPVLRPWVDVATNFTGTFGALGGPNLDGERQFLLQWRAINQNNGREAIRSASFRIDTTPPSVTGMALTNLLDPGNTENICRRGAAQFRTIARRSDLATRNFPITHPNLSQILGNPESDWVVRLTPAGQLLTINFDEIGEMRYAWDSLAQLTSNPVVLTPRNRLDSLLNTLNITSGLHTLWFQSVDGAGNASAPQSVTVLFDNQPPAVEFKYPSGVAHLNVYPVVGPTTPLRVETEDAEFGTAMGTLTVLADPPVVVELNEGFTLGETNIAANFPPEIVAGFVTIVAEVEDKVGNSVTENFTVYYDFTRPNLATHDVEGAVQFADGTFRTDERTVTLRVRVDDPGAGFVPPYYSIHQPQTGYFVGGESMTFQTTAQGGAVYADDVMLLDGLNLINVVCDDRVGNRRTLLVQVERVDQIVPDVGGRPLELLSRRAPGLDPATPTTGVVSSVAVSADGTRYVFTSGRVDHVAGDTNGEDDIFLWEDGIIRRMSEAQDGTESNSRSRHPAISGDGRLVFFASEATNLTADGDLGGVNVFYKEVMTGRVALLTRTVDGKPANLNAAFGLNSFTRMSATFNGRYLFFHDRFASYVEEDTNTNHDIFVADLDPDVNGDFFDVLPVIRRVNLGPGGVEGTGGLNTQGSLRPMCSFDGRRFCFDTTHTNLTASDTNGTTIDAIAGRFAGVDEDGTIDFSTIELHAVNRFSFGSPMIGQQSALQAAQTAIDPTGGIVAFVTAQNLAPNEDINSEGADNDVYASWEGGTFTNRAVVFYGGNSGGLVAPTLFPSVSYRSTEGHVIGYVANKRGLTGTDRPNPGDDVNDLFVRLVDFSWQRPNWLANEIPTSAATSAGGISPDGRWAWWIINENYPGGIGSGNALYRRRTDTHPAGITVTPVGALETTEAGAAAQFTVALATKPNANVTMLFESTDDTEGVPDIASVTFTPSDFDINRMVTVTVTGQPDDLADGDREYTVRVVGESGDSLYDNLLAAELLFTNADDDIRTSIVIE